MAQKANGNKPVKTYRIGSVSCSLFLNQSGERQFHSMQIQRRYRDGEDTKFSNSFTLADLPLVIQVSQMALEYVACQEAEVSG